MEVEEDPSSQFVDFTNATALEQFVSDVEQTLIAWQLSNKGHASPEALSAALPPAQQQQSASAATASNNNNNALDAPLTWTRVLELEQPSSGAKSCYALTLFVRNTLHDQHRTDDTVASDTSNGSTGKPSAKKWQHGLEHFTPTMLSIADTTRDFHWHNSRRCQQTQRSQCNNVYNFADTVESHNNNSVLFEAPTLQQQLQQPDALDTKRLTFERVQKWFGVDAFVFLSRTAQRAAKRPASTMHRARPAVHESTTTTAPTSDAVSTERSIKSSTNSSNDRDADDTVDDALISDLHVSPNEAALLLSALTIALTNCNCTLPAFVPTAEPSRGAWLGSAVPGATGNVSIAFETDSIPEVSSNQSCISGLLDFFRLKLQLPLAIEDQYRSGRINSANTNVDDAADNDVPIGMLVSASFGYTWTRAEDPREVEAAELGPMADDAAPPDVSATDSVEAAQRMRVVRDLFGAAHASQCVGVVGSASPLLGLDLTVMWPNLREGTFVDNVVHSSLDAKQAPVWTLEARFASSLRADNPRKPALALAKVVANLVQAYATSRELSRDILVSELAPNNLPPSTPSSLTPTSSSGSLVAPSTLSSSGSTTTGSTLLTALSPTSVSTQSTPSRQYESSIPAARAAVVIGNAIGTLTSSLKSAATWKGTDVDAIRRTVVELFDDTEKLLPLRDDAVASHARVGSAHATIAHSAPIGELVSIIACRMGLLHGLSAMSLLWVECVKMLRERWFQLELLPAMSTTVEGNSRQQRASPRSLDALFLLDSASLAVPAPDFHQCLLHQKLQLLNCCILRQAENARSQPPATSTSQFAGNEPTPSASDLTSFTLDDDDDDVDSTEDSPASDDEFFDSIEQHELSSSSAAPSNSTSSTTNTVAQGVRRPIPGVYCVTTNAPMCEPITQVAAPMTEDNAKQQQELLVRLGASTESALLRQQLQSAALVSDMQAFKAANPRCHLADFVRWYSPKDWIPFTADTDTTVLPSDGLNNWWFAGHGMLSDRMRCGPNGDTNDSDPHLWQQLWATASPVPVAQQKCLFDPLHEAERVYHYLETISPHELFHQMLAGAFASAVYTLETALPFASAELPVLDAALDRLRIRASRAIALLDDALTESQVAIPTGRRDQREAHERANGQLQVAFEMALDASWTLVRDLEAVEAFVAMAQALVTYFPPIHDVVDPEQASASIELVNLLLLPHAGSYAQTVRSYSYKGSYPHFGRRSMAELLQVPALRERVTMLVLLNPVLAGPVQREYVLRCISPRPYLRGDVCATEIETSSNNGGPNYSVDNDASALEESPLVVNRMYAAFSKNTVRFALVLAESEF